MKKGLRLKRKKENNQGEKVQDYVKEKMELSKKTFEKIAYVRKKKRENKQENRLMLENIKPGNNT